MKAHTSQCEYRANHTTDARKAFNSSEDAKASLEVRTLPERLFLTTMIDLRTKPGWEGSEDSLQIQSAAFIKKELYNRGLPQVFHHCGNGGNRSQREAGKFKLMGVLPGVPDIFLPLRSGEYCGLYIELKNGKGKPSEAQIDYMTTVAGEGYLCLLVNDIEVLKSCVTEYLNQR